MPEIPIVSHFRCTSRYCLEKTCKLYILLVENLQGNPRKFSVSEICAKRIRVNQGVGVFQLFVYSELNLLAVGTLNITFAKFTQDLK